MRFTGLTGCLSRKSAFFGRLIRFGRNPDSLVLTDNEHGTNSMEDRQGSTKARLWPAACAVGFFWLFAIHILTGCLDFITKGGVGGRSGGIAAIDTAINRAVVIPLGGPLAAGLLFLAGIGAGWLVYRVGRGRGAA